MATLQNIRNKGPLLIIVIGFALVAFIIGEFLMSAGDFFGGRQEHVGEIAGERIHFLEFQSAVDQLTDVHRIETGERDFNEEITAQIRASVWETMVNDRLLLREAKKIGLTVTDEELADRTIGNNTHPIIAHRQVFFDETGRFNRNVLIDFLLWINQDLTGLPHGMQSELITWQNYWMFWENLVRMEILREKFNALISNAVTANNIDARSSFDARQRLVNFSYVAQQHFMVSDDVAVVTPREIRDRYNRDREHRFRQEASRSINYVVFDVVPMEEDFAQMEEWMERASEEFRTTDDIIGFINANSDVMYDGRNFSELNVPVLLRHFAFNANEGDFFGPVFLNDTYTMARLMQTGIVTSDSVRLSHIYFFPGEEQLADSIFRVVQRNRANFGTVARQYSRAQQTAVNDGQIGWLIEGMRNIDREFLDAFNKNAGDIFMFTNHQGTQIVKVTEKTPPRQKVRLAILERRVRPSNNTQRHIFNTARQFAVGARNVERFQTLAEEKGLFVRSANNLDENANRVGMLAQSRPIVRWAFNANLGNVSDVFETDNQFVVAVVTEVNQRGFAPLERVSAEIEAELIRERQLEYIARDISNRLTAGATLETLARELNVEIWEANNVNFASQTFGASGIEPAVIGNALNVPMHQLSAPIIGNASVFVVLPTSEILGTEEFNPVMEIAHLNNRNRQMLPFLIFNDIRRNANVVDTRSIFF